jgi:hypothetical protein
MSMRKPSPIMRFSNSLSDTVFFSLFDNKRRKVRTHDEGEEEVEPEWLAAN